MAAKKPVAKKLKKRVKKGAKAVRKTLEAKRGRAGAKAAGVAAAGMVGIAGIATIVHLLRRDARGRARLHVIASDAEWLITAEGKDEPIDRFRTKEEAVEAGREAAQKAAPSELVIHRLDGTVMRSHSYAAS